MSIGKLWFAAPVFLLAAGGIAGAETVVRSASLQEVRLFFREQDKTVVTFVGYSGAGYQDGSAMLRAAGTVLEGYDPDSTLVNIGVTPDGIGRVYELAKEMGFMTTGIVSVQAQKYQAGVSAALDFGFYIEDETWGGFVDDTELLSPTSRAMVENSDVIVAIGGGEVSRDEVTFARQHGKEVLYFPAEMNHEKAIAKARKKGLPEPTDFLGPVNQLFAGSGE
jgi:hypothetical protein